MAPQKPNLNEADHKAIADQIVARLKKDLAPAKPLHEMSEMERTAYANEVWAASGIIGDQHNVGRTMPRRPL
jgi:hypothetical protein